MKEIDLGFMKIPLEGSFNHAKLVFGIFVGCILTCLALGFSDKEGPALYSVADPTKMIQKCRYTLVVTAVYHLLYMNYVGVQVITAFAKGVWKLISDEDTTDVFEKNAGRFAGNMLEQSPVFLSALWTYTLFVDYSSGWVLGVLYIIRVGLYPLFYIANHKFDFWFEMCTQTGYGVYGTLILGLLVTGAGGDWVAFAGDHEVGAGILGFLLGSFAFVPGLPLAPIYTFVWYKRDNAVKSSSLQSS